MADYPTPSQYQEAMQHPAAALADPDLQNATPRTNALGLPQPITGGFAAVFPMTTSTGARYAAKCFLKERPRQEARYEAIAAHLATVEIDALVEFDYQPEGIRVRGTAYPLLKMAWAQGTVLNRFVENHLDAPEVLTRTADAWADLMATLEANTLAHGDLQHGNVLVQEDDGTPRFRLVDYDTVYVPALDGWHSAEVGHRNYQHPDRTDTDFGPHLDRFAGLVIYTALRACAHQPALWERYDTGENLLFRDADFYDPEQSALFEDLAALSPLSESVEALRTACYVEPDAVPLLADVRAGRAEPSARPVRRSRDARSPRHRRRSGFARVFLPALLAMLGAAAGLGLAGWPLIAGLVAGVGGLGGVGEAARRYRRLSLVRRRRRLEQEVQRFAEAIRALEREHESLTEKRAELRNSMDDRRAKRLAELRDEALRDHLKHHFIGEIRDLDGIIHKHVVRLKAANIRTAYEATPEALAQVRRISDEARTRIRMWRAALAQKYEDEIPDELSPAEERRLRRYVEHRIEDIDEQRARTRDKIEVQATERERVRDRLADMPALPFARYLRYLCGLDTLPDPVTDRPTASAERKGEAARAPDPVPAPAEEDGTWWRRSRSSRA